MIDACYFYDIIVISSVTMAHFLKQIPESKTNKTKTVAMSHREVFVLCRTVHHYEGCIIDTLGDSSSRAVGA